MTARFDIAIIGAGPVGAALALALRGSNLNVCVLEARPQHTARQDARALALSYGSRLILARLGVWDKLQEVSAIHTIHISQKQSFGRTVLRAAEMNVPALGYVLPYASLQHDLAQALRGSGIKCIYNANATRISIQHPGADTAGESAMIGYEHHGAIHELSARLVVVADGGKLLLQQYPREIHDYGQSAIITQVTCAAPQPDTAFERFTPHGPLALLPFRDGYALVWTAPHQAAQQMLNWNDAEFLRELHRHFGDRVGEFIAAGPRVCFPLSLQRAPQQSPMPHTILIGNAAQSLHPVAGQGFNMGLRDAGELARKILAAPPRELGTPRMLAAYRLQRRIDREAGIKFTDGLVRLFSNDLPVISPGRAAALTLLDCLPFAKSFVAKRMMFGAN